ncbi:hypothetical protein EsH8_VII_000542 [Colletotrichum jinshuiense]
MCGHVMRGRFTPRCSDCGIDYSTTWPPQVRIPALILITLFLAWMHPDIANTVKRALWVAVKPIALLIGWVSVAFIRTLIFLFIDGPKIATALLSRDVRDDLDGFGIDIENNAKLNAIWTHLHVEEEFVPGGVFDKKYKPFLPTKNMKLGGYRQQKAMVRSRSFTC